MGWPLPTHVEPRRARYRKMRRDGRRAGPGCRRLEITSGYNLTPGLAETPGIG